MKVMDNKEYTYSLLVNRAISTKEREAGESEVIEISMHDNDSNNRVYKWHVGSETYLFSNKRRRQWSQRWMYRCIEGLKSPHSMMNSYTCLKQKKLNIVVIFHSNHKIMKMTYVFIQELNEYWERIKRKNKKCTYNEYNWQILKPS